MVKTRRSFVLATCFLSGAAAILSFVSLGTQEWVTSSAKSASNFRTNPDDDFVRFGLFGGLFKQTTAVIITYELTMVCAYDLNICALLCGDNMEDNLRKLYKFQTVSPEILNTCPSISDQYAEKPNHFLLATNNTDERIFINAGIYICTLVFLVLSAVMGVISSLLAVWNTASNSQNRWFNILGLYLSNTIAFFSVLLAIILWGVMFAKDIILNVPFYETYIFNFTTKNFAHLGYSYWLNLASLILYLLSLCLLYIRSYLVSKQATHIQSTTNDFLEDNRNDRLLLF